MSFNLVGTLELLGEFFNIFMARPYFISGDGSQESVLSNTPQIIQCASKFENQPKRGVGEEEELSVKG